MKALTYQGAKDVRVENVPDPILMADDDIILKVTATAICGSDLHIYRGKIPAMKHGDILGHEFMGVVEETGPGVTGLKRATGWSFRLSSPAANCFYCNKTLFAACETTNPGRGAIMNKKSRRQAPVCSATATCMAAMRAARPSMSGCPKPTSARCVSRTCLERRAGPFSFRHPAHGLPGRRQRAARPRLVGGHLRRRPRGVDVGPVGAFPGRGKDLHGGPQRLPAQLRAQETYGVIPINFDKDDDPAETILKATDGHGVDATIDAIGFEAKGSALETALTAIKMEGSSGKALRSASQPRAAAAWSAFQVFMPALSMVSFSAMRSKRTDLQDGADPCPALHAGVAGAHRQRQDETRGDHQPPHEAWMRRSAATKSSRVKKKNAEKSYAPARSPHPAA
jgi:hypothetical protein